MSGLHDTGTDMLRCGLDDGVATITFDNPAKRNAMSGVMRRALPAVLERLEADPEVRVVVISGAGEHAFMSGADISEFGDQRTSPEARAAYDAALDEIDRAWAGLTCPIIARIRGYCLGVGLVTALRADIRVAADDAVFAIPAARLGLGLRFANIEPLVELVGPAAASEVLFTARRFTAVEAHGIGLVNQVVAVDELDPVVDSLARSIATNAPLTVAAAKAAVVAARRAPADRDLAGVEARVEAAFRSEDYLEGQAAFAQKRPPRFRGR